MGRGLKLLSKMIDEKYILNWNTFSDHLREMFFQMKMSNEFTDVTLVCDDFKQFHAHKVVLSACSSIFKNILNVLPQKNSVIYLRGVKQQEMESILDFIYLGKTTIDQNRINEFLDISKNLEIKNIGKDLELDEIDKTHDATGISRSHRKDELVLDR